MTNQKYIEAIEKYGFITFAGVIYALNSHDYYEYEKEFESEPVEYYQTGIAPSGESVIIDFDSEYEPYSVSLGDD